MTTRRQFLAGLLKVSAAAVALARLARPAQTRHFPQRLVFFDHDGVYMSTDGGPPQLVSARINGNNVQIYERGQWR